MTAAKQLKDDKLLKSLLPFGELDDNQFRMLEGQTRRESFESGKMLFKQGESDNRTYFLISGQVTFRYADGTIKNILANTPQARYALVPMRPRQATATAKTPITVLSMDAGLFDEILNLGNQQGYQVSEIETEDHNDWMTCFLQSKVFLRLPAQNIQALMMRLEEIPAKAGTVIVRQGDDDGYYYIIKSGRCKVSRRHSPKDNEIELASLTVGEGFGEEAIITHNRRGASVTMVEDGCLMRLSRNDFNRLLVEPLITIVTYLDVAEKDDAVFLDVRNYDDFVRDGIAGSENIALTELRIKLDKFQASKQYVVCSNTGSRAAAAAFLLCQQGIDAVVLRYGLENLPENVQRGNGPIADLENVPVVDNVVDFNKDKLPEESVPELQPENGDSTAPITKEQAMDDPRVQALFSKAKNRVQKEAGRAQEAEFARKQAEKEANRLKAEAEKARQELEEAKKQANKAAKDSAVAARLQAKKEAARLRELELGAKQAEMEEAVRQAEEEANRAQEANQALKQAELEIDNLKNEMQAAVEKTQQEAKKSAEAIRQFVEQEGQRQREEAARIAEKEAERAREAEIAHQKAQQEIERLKAEAEATRLKLEEQARQEAERARIQAEQHAAKLRAEELAKEQVAKEIAAREAAAAAKRAQEAEQARQEAEAEKERWRQEAEIARVSAENEAALKRERELAAKQAEAEAAIQKAVEEARKDSEAEIEKLRKQAEQAKDAEHARKRAEEEIERVKQQAEQERLRIEEQAIRVAEAARAEAVEEATKITAAKQSEIEEVAKRAEEEAMRAKQAEEARRQAEQEVERLRADTEQARGQMQEQLSSEIARSEIEHEVAKARAIELANKQAEIEEVTTKADSESQRAQAAEEARTKAEQEIARLKAEMEELSIQQNQQVQQHPSGELSAAEQQQALVREKSLAHKQAEIEEIARIAADENARATAAEDARKEAESEIERLRTEVEVATLQAQAQLQADTEKAAAEEQAIKERAAELELMQAKIHEAELKAQQEEQRAHQAEVAQRQAQEQLARLKAAEEANYHAQQEIQRLKAEAGLASSQAQQQAKLTAEEIQQKAEIEIQRARSEEAARKQAELAEAARKTEEESKRAELAEQAQKKAELEIKRLKTEAELQRVKSEKVIQDTIKAAKKQLDSNRVKNRAAEKARMAVEKGRTNVRKKSASVQGSIDARASANTRTAQTVKPNKAQTAKPGVKLESGIEISNAKSSRRPQQKSNPIDNDDANNAWISDQVMWETALGMREDKVAQEIIQPKQSPQARHAAPHRAASQPDTTAQQFQQNPNRPAFQAREVNPYVSTQDVTGVVRKSQRSGGISKYIFVAIGFFTLVAAGYYLTLDKTQREDHRAQIKGYIGKETPLTDLSNKVKATVNKMAEDKTKARPVPVEPASKAPAVIDQQPVLSLEERMEKRRQLAIEKDAQRKKALEGPAKEETLSLEPAEATTTNQQPINTLPTEILPGIGGQETGSVEVNVVNELPVQSQSTPEYADEISGEETPPSSNSLAEPLNESDVSGILPLRDEQAKSFAPNSPDANANVEDGSVVEVSGAISVVVAEPIEADSSEQPVASKKENPAEEN